MFSPLSDKQRAAAPVSAHFTHFQDAFDDSGIPQRAGLVKDESAYIKAGADTRSLPLMLFYEILRGRRRVNISYRFYAISFCCSIQSSIASKESAYLTLIVILPPSWTRILSISSTSIGRVRLSILR